MAFTVDYTDPLTGHPRYNIDESISTDGGEKEDLRLIQVLINMLYFDLADQGRPRGFKAPEKRRLVEDGLMGDHTANFVDHCWRTFIKNGANLAPIWSVGASTIDPMRRRGELSTLMHVNYFLDLLNENVSYFDVEAKLGRYPLLRWDEKVPAALRNALKTVKSTAAKYEDLV
jgi:hypothetical protein